MSEIPVMKCPECDALMEYRGGPSDSNIFIMICTATVCRYQETCYAENLSQAHYEMFGKEGCYAQKNSSTCAEEFG